MKPIVKCVGSKMNLLEHVQYLMPPTCYNNYFELFGGSCALLFGLAPEYASVSIANPELLNMYLQIRERVENVIETLTILDQLHEEATDPKLFYYEIRDEFNSQLNTNTAAQAARLIYLSKHSTGGISKADNIGEFTLSFNGKVTGDSFDPVQLRMIAKQLQPIDFSLGNFEDTLVDVREGDFVFFDSPYVTSITESEESLMDKQTRLAKVFKDLSEKGVFCLLTNPDSELIQDLYKDYRITKVEKNELIITNY